MDKTIILPIVWAVSITYKNFLNKAWNTIVVYDPNDGNISIRGYPPCQDGYRVFFGRFCTDEILEKTLDYINIPDECEILDVSSSSLTDASLDNLLDLISKSNLRFLHYNEYAYNEKLINELTKALMTPLNNRCIRTKMTVKSAAKIDN